MIPKSDRKLYELYLAGIYFDSTIIAHATHTYHLTESKLEEKVRSIDLKLNKLLETKTDKGCKNRKRTRYIRSNKSKKSLKKSNSKRK